MQPRHSNRVHVHNGDWEEFTIWLDKFANNWFITELNVGIICHLELCGIFAKLIHYIWIYNLYLNCLCKPQNDLILKIDIAVSYLRQSITVGVIHTTTIQKLQLRQCSLIDNRFGVNQLCFIAKITLKIHKVGTKALHHWPFVRRIYCWPLD